MRIIKPNTPITNWNESHQAFNRLRSILGTDVEALNKLRKIRIVDSDFGSQGYKFEPEQKSCDDYVLRIASEKGNVIKKIKDALGLNQEQTSVPEETLQGEKAASKIETHVELTPEQASLSFVSDILDRAYNRRTTLTSWGLYFLFKYWGLKQDDFEPMSKVLKDDYFAKVFTEYRRLAKENQTRADNYLSNVVFEKKEGDEISSEIKQKLVKTASFLIDNYNKLNMRFVTSSPKIFGIQNIVMPFLKSWFPKVKLFDFMVTLNPWLSEISENLGNYVGEIKNIQDIYSEKEAEEKVIFEVNLTPLSDGEFSLKNITRNIYDGVDRVLGKESTLSSIIINKLVGLGTGGQTFSEFAKQFTDDGFIKTLYKDLKNNTGSSPEFKFKDSPEKSWGAKIIWGITSLARSIPSEKITKASNIFGGIFVPLNLAMPLLAKVFNKGLMGFITNSLLKIFPILSDFVFDNAANFSKEILAVQKETSDESIAKLFPQIDPKATYESFISKLSDLYESAKGFISAKFSRKAVP